MPLLSSFSFRRRSLVLFGVSVACVLALLVGISLTKPFGIDEFLYMHWGAEAARGRFAGRDYFAIHFPGLQIFLAPVFALFPSDSVASLRASRLVTLVFFLGTVAVGALNFSGRKRWLALALLLTTGAFAASGIEVRPDVLSLFFFSSGAFLYFANRSLSGAFGAGISMACAIICSEKALLHGVAFAVALLFSLARDGRAGKFRSSLGRALLCALATALPLGVVAAELWREDGLHHFRLWLEYARLHEAAYPTQDGLGLKSLWQLLNNAPLLFLAPVGALSLFRSALRGGATPAAGRALFLVSAGVAGILSLVIQKAPYRYSWIPFAYFGTLWSVEALGALWDAIGKRASRLARWRWAVGLAILLAVAAELRTSGKVFARSSNALQLSTLRDIYALTAPEDCVYDNSAIAVTRRHADDYFVTTDAVLRLVSAERLSNRMPAAIRERRCAVFVWDLRAPALPGPLLEFLKGHFVPVANDIHLWGMRYPAGSTRVSFEALRDGEYYLWPESARFRSGASVATLKEGAQELEVTSDTDFAIVFKPPRLREPLPVVNEPVPAAFLRL